MPADRRDLRRRLFALAAGQGGYFTAAEAKAIGYSYQAQAHHVQAGNWLRIDRGLFRLAEWVPDRHDDLIRWTLWSKRRGVISHESALSTHGVGEFDEARVHLTVPPGFAMRDAAAVVHEAELADGDVELHAGFKVTTVLRSLVDVAVHAQEDQLARAIEEARDSGLITVRRLRSRAEAVDVRAALHIERALHRAPAG